MIRAYIAAAALLICFGAGWAANGWRLNGQIAEMDASAAKAARAAEVKHRAREQELSNQINEARNAAIEREKILAAAAGLARAESERLHSDLAAIRLQLPRLTEKAVRQYADAASLVLNECQREYQSLAEQADRIDSDRQTLTDAWPK